MFQDNIDVKIGRILFENKTGADLYKVAYGLKNLFDESEGKDQISGTMAVETAVASYFEGHTPGAALASFCMLKGSGYRGMDAADVRMMFEFYSEAGAGVNHVCAFNLAQEYEQGYPPYITANPYVATMWYKKAADAGNVTAQFEMGNRYYNGVGAEIDYQKAETYWLAAAEEGHVNAQYNLGCLYGGLLSDGPSMTTLEPEKAGYWLEQAARAGDNDAAEILNQSFRFNQRKNKWQKID